MEKENLGKLLKKAIMKMSAQELLRYGYEVESRFDSEEFIRIQNDQDAIDFILDFLDNAFADRKISEDEFFDERDRLNLRLRHLEFEEMRIEFDAYKNFFGMEKAEELIRDRLEGLYMKGHYFPNVRAYYLRNIQHLNMLFPGKVVSSLS